MEFLLKSCLKYSYSNINPKATYNSLIVKINWYMFSVPTFLLFKTQVSQTLPIVTLTFIIWHFLYLWA